MSPRQFPKSAKGNPGKTGSRARGTETAKRRRRWGLKFFATILGLLAAIWIAGSVLLREKPVAANKPGPSPAIVESANVPSTGDRSVPASRNEPALLEHKSAGLEFLRQGQPAEAVREFRAAAVLGPNDEDVHFNLGIALARQGELEEAKQHYLEALRLMPDYAEAHNNLGNLFLRQGKLEEAIDQFQSVLKTMPENATAHNNLGTALAQQKLMAEAMAHFREAKRILPEYSEAHFNLATACLALEQPAEAVAEFEETLRLKPGFAPALQGLEKARQKIAGAAPPANSPTSPALAPSKN
jgi:Tfp pilus assembly protein PilF